MVAPGRREFVVEAPAGDAAVFAALARSFTLAGHHGASCRRLWLDTFDWRLYRAGLVLELEQARRGGRLRLSTADGAPQAEQPVTGWPPRRPRPAGTLPAGQVRDRIMPLTGPRALLPVVKAVSAVSVTRLLNADGKTVARLVADRSAVTAADAAAITAELPPRLAVAGVRGYPGPAREAAALVAAVPGVSAAGQGPFAAAAAALQLHPPDTGLEVGITAATPASVAVAWLLLRLLDTVELNTRGVLRDIDTEFLHDFRVAVRRTRSAVKLLGGVLPDDLARQYAAEFKWLGDLTTPTRDLDVHLLGFDATAGRLIAASRDDLEPLRGYLARRRAREFRRLAAALRGPRFRAITDDWRKALLKIRDAGGPGTPAAAELARSTTGRAYRRIAAHGARITPAAPPEALHDLRKRAKELRYLLEFFAPLHEPAAYRKVLRDLKQLQDCLGEFQDSQVQREEIRALAGAMLAEQAAPAGTLLAMGEIAANLAASQAGARADFARRFAGLAGPAGQHRIQALLAKPGDAQAGGR